MTFKPAALVSMTFAVLAVGCDLTDNAPDRATERPSARPTATASALPNDEFVAAAEPVVRSSDQFLTVTDAARKQLLQITKEAGLKDHWWVRLEFHRGGCQGIQAKLDLDPDQPRPTDAVGTSNGIRVVYRKDQDVLIQGTVINFKNAGGEVGFTVLSPNKTKENQEATRAWIQREPPKPARPGQER
jgi:iron-sulfur cluster assembly accessory protein